MVPMYKAVVNRREKSLVVYGTSLDNGYETVKAWKDGNAVKKEEMIQVFEVTEKVIFEEIIK